MKWRISLVEPAMANRPSERPTVTPGSGAAAQVLRRMRDQRDRRAKRLYRAGVTDRGMTCRRIELKEPILHTLA